MSRDHLVKLKINNTITITDYQNLLGFGEFGKVYRGRINSANGSLHYANISSNYQNCSSLEVAVKTVGTDVDVEHFKALLSEIKILIHIGAHRNIVTIVAACTQNIRQRKPVKLYELKPSWTIITNVSFCNF